MKPKKFSSFSDLVYSTNADAMKSPEQEEAQELEPEQQRLHVSLDRRRRGGKTVTLVTGFEGDEEALKTIGRQLKAKCGTGGSVKEGEIIIQGDCRSVVVQWLKNRGYGVQ